MGSATRTIGLTEIPRPADGKRRCGVCCLARESISRPGGLGGPNPHNPIAVRAYEAEVSLILLVALVAQKERISELEAMLQKQSKARGRSAK